MPQRRKSPRAPSKRSFRISTLMPWWGWVLLAPLSYFAFRHLAHSTGSQTTDSVTSLAVSSLQQVVPAALQFSAPLCCLVCAVFALIHRLPDQVDTRLTVARPKNTAARSMEHEHAPPCPLCSSAMAKRYSSKSQQISAFWGCTRYPSCRGTRAF